jgi:hypothetical protein
MQRFSSGLLSLQLWSAVSWADPLQWLMTALKQDPSALISKGFCQSRRLMTALAANLIFGQYS